MANNIPKSARQLAVDLGEILIFMMVIFIIFFIGTSLVAYLWSPTPSYLIGFKNSISGNVEMNLGIPCAAVGAFGVVMLLLNAFPPEKQNGIIKFNVFGLEFTGPAGPITLWLACFVSFVASIYWLKK